MIISCTHSCWTNSEQKASLHRSSKGSNLTDGRSLNKLFIAKKNLNLRLNKNTIKIKLLSLETTCLECMHDILSLPLCTLYSVMARVWFGGSDKRERVRESVEERKNKGKVRKSRDVTAGALSVKVRWPRV